MSPESFVQKHQDLEKNVTLGTLLEYTDEFLLPKMQDMVDASEKRMLAEMKEMRADLQGDIGRMNHDLKLYIDEKLADYTSDIFQRLDKKYQKEKEFKQKVIEIFKKNNLGSPEDIAFLEGALGA